VQEHERCSGTLPVERKHVTVCIPTNWRAGAIITICDGLIIDYLLYGKAHKPKDIADRAAVALS
jgi:hypothetical protein